MSLHQTKHQKVIRLTVDGTNFQAAAGTSDLTSGAVDMQGFESARFLYCLGTITSGAVTSIKAQQCDTTGGSYADLLGTSVTVADTDDNKVVSLEIVQPLERFLKVVIDRGTQNAVVESLVVILSGSKELPIADDSTTVVGSEVHVSPIEGTA